MFDTEARNNYMTAAENLGSIGLNEDQIANIWGHCSTKPSVFYAIGDAAERFYLADTTVREFCEIAKLANDTGEVGAWANDMDSFRKLLKQDLASVLSGSVERAIGELVRK